MAISLLEATAMMGVRSSSCIAIICHFPQHQRAEKNAFWVNNNIVLCEIEVWLKGRESCFSAVAIIHEKIRFWGSWVAEWERCNRETNCSNFSSKQHLRRYSWNPSYRKRGGGVRLRFKKRVEVVEKGDGWLPLYPSDWLRVDDSRRPDSSYSTFFILYFYNNSVHPLTFFIKEIVVNTVLAVGKWSTEIQWREKEKEG